MKSPKHALIFVCRYPYKGSVKTRLAQFIGKEKTAHLYAAFLRDIFLWGSNSDHFDLLISLADGHLQESFAKEFDLPVESVFGQIGDDFGARLAHSLQVAFDRGFSRAAVAASDAPELYHDEIVSAFVALDDHDISIIPSYDGGYSFLAMKEPIDVFTGVEMSTAVVLEQTLNLARAGNWTFSIRSPVADVDEIDDLERLIGLLKGDAEMRARLPNITRFIKGKL